MATANKWNEFLCRFYEWRSTTKGSAIWLIRSFAGISLSTAPVMFDDISSKLIVSGIFLLIISPDLIEASGPIFWYVSRILYFGRFKPGQILCLRSIQGKEVKTVLISTELNHENSRGTLHETFYRGRGDYLVMMSLFSEFFTKSGFDTIPPNGSLVFVIEREHVNKNPFWFSWNPFRENSAKVKVLYDNKIYWANPKHFKRLRKPK